jgi:regulator of ribonuclease activity A
MFLVIRSLLCGTMKAVSSPAATPPSPPPVDLLSLPTADLYDQYLDTARVPEVAWRSLGGKAHAAGRVVTIQCGEDNSRLKELVTTTEGHGRMLVVDAGGSRRCAMVGDQLAAAAHAHHWSGLVIYGSVRDVAVLRTLDVGIWALGSTPRKSTRRGEGQVDLAIRIGHVEVHPGDYCIADEDGVLFLRPDQVE